MNGNWEHIERQLSQTLNKDIRFSKVESISGGCINQGWKANDKDDNHWFIKTNQPHLLFMFEAEYQGLKELRKANSIRVPKPIVYGATEKRCYLVMEYITLSGNTQTCLTGKQLAQMHQHQSNTFGWKIDNSIGNIPQPNKPNEDWINFWRQERLEFQLNLALANNLNHKTYDQGIELSNKTPAFFSTHAPKASLLHGDLWGGNIAYDQHQQPVIFDPAVYYGDHEADLAMTELFGGFGQQFYDCYQEHFPIDSDYPCRKKLYNLYHILNHFNLFGGSYQSQVEVMIEQLLSEV